MREYQLQRRIRLYSIIQPKCVLLRQPSSSLTKAVMDRPRTQWRLSVLPRYRNKERHAFQRHRSIRLEFVRSAFLILHQQQYTQDYLEQQLRCWSTTFNVVMLSSTLAVLSTTIISFLRQYARPFASRTPVDVANRSSSTPDVKHALSMNTVLQ